LLLSSTSITVLLISQYTNTSRTTHYCLCSSESMRFARQRNKQARATQRGYSLVSLGNLDIPSIDPETCKLSRDLTTHRQPPPTTFALSSLPHMYAYTLSPLPQYSSSTASIVLFALSTTGIQETSLKVVGATPHLKQWEATTLFIHAIHTSKHKPQRVGTVLIAQPGWLAHLSTPRLGCWRGP
jgi:hypothetical protein